MRIGRIEYAQIIAGAADRVEDGLARSQESEAVRPSVIVRGSIGILSRELQRVRSTVGWTSASLVRAILADEHASCQRMIVGCKADGVAIAISPRERLDRGVWLRRVQPSAQDGAVADAMMRCALERFHGCARARHAKWRIPAGHHSSPGVEHVVAQHDVLARNILLVLTAAIVEADHAAVGG